MTNSNLHKARYQNKNDEFYTQYADIENELKHYEDQFKGKTVYCNCDDFRSSEFYKYFVTNFAKLGLKKIITTCYKTQQTTLSSNETPAKAIYFEYVGWKSEMYNLKGDGDFRSSECIEILKQADVIITNPPFSLFREYVYQLMKYNKKFLILGDINKMVNRKIFSFIHSNKIWCGYYFGSMSFNVPEQGLKHFGNISWFTNLDVKKRHENLKLSAKYIPENYPKYNNYNIINVDNLKDIPADYDGVMGVPITFIYKHNPNQFEILGLANPEAWYIHKCVTKIGKRDVYNRLLIKHKRKTQ